MFFGELNISKRKIIFQASLLRGYGSEEPNPWQFWHPWMLHPRMSSSLGACSCKVRGMSGDPDRLWG